MNPFRKLTVFLAAAVAAVAAALVAAAALSSPDAPVTPAPKKTATPSPSTSTEPATTGIPASEAAFALAADIEAVAAAAGTSPEEFFEDPDGANWAAFAATAELDPALTVTNQGTGVITVEDAETCIDLLLSPQRGGRTIVTACSTEAP